jgi:hypothetical protein
MLVTLLALALATALGTGAQAAAAQQDPKPEPPITLERVLERLDAIAQAAERLEAMGASEESRALALRIRQMAQSLKQEIETPRGPPPEAPQSAELLPRVSVSGRRADPKSWQPVTVRKQVRTEWGTNAKDAPPGGTSNRIFIGEHHAALAPGSPIFKTHTEPHRDFTFQDCIFEGAAGPDGKPRARWGIRAYDVIDWRFVHCEWRNIPDEHGCYLSAPGSVVWNKCRFLDMGSQAIQVVYRWEGGSAHETSNPALRAVGGLQHVSECIFLECGKPSGGRPAFALSFFEGPIARVRIERSYLQTLYSQHLDHEGLPAWSYGAIMVHDRPRVELIDNYIHYRKPDRPVIQIWNVDEVLIQDCEIVEGTIELRNCKRVRITGNKGGAHVVVGAGVEGVWPMSSVRHEGPLAVDYPH